MATASRTDGVVSLALTSAKGWHMALLERVGDRIRIVDRSGFYNSLAELSKRYQTTFAVDVAGVAVFLKNITARMPGGVASLMMTTNGLAVKLEGKTTIAALVAKVAHSRNRAGRSRPAG